MKKAAAALKVMGQPSRMFGGLLPPETQKKLEEAKKQADKLLLREPNSQ